MRVIAATRSGLCKKIGASAIGPFKSRWPRSTLFCPLGRVPKKLFIKKRSDKIQKRKNKNQEKENGNNTSKMSKL